MQRWIEGEEGWQRNLGRRSAAARGASGDDEEGRTGGERREAGNQLSRQNVEYV